MRDESSTVGRVDGARGDEIAGHELSVRERYQFKPFPGSSHSWAVDHLRTLVARKDGRPEVPLRLLDVGPGRGDMGAIARELGFHRVDAVEPDEEARSHAASVYDSAVPSLEQLPETPYDVVLLLDVLEHMAAPEDFLLRQLLPYVESGSRVLLSVPNVAHWSVRLGLLFGRFEYADRGILDRTHLQFFTHRRVKSLARCVSPHKGWEYRVSVEPIEYFIPKKIWRSQWYERFIGIPRVWVAQCLPGLLGYQHLVSLEISTGE